MPKIVLRRHPAFALGLLLLLITAPLTGQSLKRKAAPKRSLSRELDQALANPEFHRGFWGVYVYSLDHARVVYRHNADQYFLPASNAKLFTLAAALHLLGVDYRFHTTVESAAPPDATGLIAGDVRLVGSGDPSFGGRPYPYRESPGSGVPYDMMAAPRALAQQLKARGVTKISGDVVGDDSYFSDDPYPPGWAIGDELWDYGAPVNALTVNDNTQYLVLTPGAAAGEPVTGTFDPPLAPPVLVNDATTTAAGTATRVRLVDGDPACIEGTMAAGAPPVTEALAVRQPALYAARLLRAALLESGITVTGTARVDSTPATPSQFSLAAWDSPSLAQILQATAKLSQNLEAEMLLRLLGKLRGAAGTTAAGAAVRAAFLHDAGLGDDDASLVDGSGLSRTDLVTPAGVARLLEYMARQPEHDVFLSLLPVAATDGTLAHRFVATDAAGRIHAKTGSLSHVNSLSGYLTTARGEHLVFSILSNNVNRPATATRNQIDSIATLIEKY
jgi:D-alanyl-D-alanine carboxypeptidase/D-alanyl-D-alanine-endopeptidase (penicillin-binding protein 4)